MAVFGISDLHLSYGVDKPMNVFGKTWDNYEEKIKENWQSKVNENDYVIIAGDISWATYLAQAKHDFMFINNLPGKKIILKGNHDYYFNTKSKLDSFFKDNNIMNIDVLQNNAIDTEEYIICGTRGWGDTEEENVDNDKLIKREIIRLKLSLDLGIKLQKEYELKGIKKDILVATHFPPFDNGFKEVLEDYNVKKCVYGHLHGYGHKKAVEGVINEVEYVMIACDYTNFNLVQL